MMIATWRGTALTSGTSIVELVCLTMDFIDKKDQDGDYTVMISFSLSTTILSMSMTALSVIF